MTHSCVGDVEGSVGYHYCSADDVGLDTHIMSITKDVDKQEEVSYW